jgi:hypothetical protein
VTGFEGDERKVEFLDAEKTVEIYPGKTYYVVDGLKGAAWRGRSNKVVVQSFAKDRSVDSEVGNDVFAPLPTEKEMKAIGSRCLLDTDQAVAFENIYEKCGSNIRECVHGDEEVITGDYLGALSRIDLSHLSRGKVHDVMADSKDARRFFFQLQVDGQLPYLLSTCCYRRWIFSCRNACLAIYYWLVKKQSSEVDRLVLSMKELFGEGQMREQLGHAV